MVLQICEDQAYGCDLTCYDNDGGDCAGGTDGGTDGGTTTTGGSADCEACELDWSAYGSECCDTAWGEFGIDCATLEGVYGWDCAGCTCPLDTDEPAACAEGQFDCLGDGTECIPESYVCDGSSEFCNAGWGPDCSNGADEGLDVCDYEDECNAPESKE